jgi:hypothetical protein
MSELGLVSAFGAGSVEKLFNGLPANGVAHEENRDLEKFFRQKRVST